MIEYEYSQSIRQLVGKANELKLDKKDIINVIGNEREGYFLLYQVKPTKKDGQ